MKEICSWLYVNPGRWVIIQFETENWRKSCKNWGKRQYIYFARDLHFPLRHILEDSVTLLPDINKFLWHIWDIHLLKLDYLIWELYLECFLSGNTFKKKILGNSQNHIVSKFLRLFFFFFEFLLLFFSLVSA